ncbi:MAG: coenzyme F420-0:L-glutamate ligase [Candidatus Bathyarchaeota archaeon]|nr:coenzyme F420-0:L-glutamate ligase [Candidatus Bathyarchaeota archaeon]
MVKNRALAIVTGYWKPSTDFLQEIVSNIRGKVVDGDFVVVSEKAISVAMNNIVDESKVKPGLSAKFIAGVWVPIVWGRFLGVLCRFHWKLLHRLRHYPFNVGSRHKQVTLQYAGLPQSLMFGSEGGIDGSNLAYSYVSLPLRNADKVAEVIRRHVMSKIGKKVYVMIADTDKTYSFRNFHFTPRPCPVSGIHSCGSVFSFIVGRMLRLKRRATPIGVAGRRLSAEEALEIADFSNRVRGFGSGRTVWDMAERFKVGLADVSWEMLETAKHKPIVIVRRKR